MRPLSRALLFFVCLTSGCATAPETFGTRARYSPAFHGYVMAPDDGSDDPAPGQTALLLRDPLTGEKLRCREEVIDWRELHEDLASDLVEDDNAAIAAGATTASLFAPLLVVQPVGALVLAEAALTGGALYDDLASDDAYELFAGGVTLFRRHRYRQASTILERALAKDATVGVIDKAYLYLGLAYAHQQRRDRAALALTMFVTRSAVRDVDAYREAERALAELGAPVEGCQSTDPVDLSW